MQFSQKDILRFGLSGGAGSRNIDISQVDNTSDPAIRDALDKSFYLDGNFGISFQSGYLFLGVALPNFFEPNLNNFSTLENGDFAPFNEILFDARYRFYFGLYPVDQFPAHFQRFAVWGDVLTLLGREIPDGSDAYVYYGQLHVLDTSGSTIPSTHEDLVAMGAEGYAAIEWASYAINRVNIGGTTTPEEMLGWGREKLAQFRTDLHAAGRKNRVRVRSFYRPFRAVASQTTDDGP